MKASDLFVRCLEAEGVTHVFGVPGEENLDLLDSLRSSSIELVLTRHEQGAGFMAATHGRLTGRAGVCLATLGPGATNLVTAAAYANLGAMPMLMVTGQKPIKSSKQGEFQILDVVDMMRPLTKYTKQIVSGDGIPARVREAFRLAQEERPGAVHLELPEDIAHETTDSAIIRAAATRRPLADDKSIHLAVEALHRAKRPLLLIGAAANRNRTQKMLGEFVAQTSIPFVTTQMGKGVIDETHDLFIGTTALSDGDFVHRAVSCADLILNVGHDIVEKPPFFMKDGMMHVVHVNYFSARVDPVYFPQLEVVGDIANSIWRIKEALDGTPSWDRETLLRARAARDACDEDATPTPAVPLDPRTIVTVVQDTLQPNGVVTLDNGIYKIWFARGFRARHPNELLLDNALATMGAGLPSGMAAALLDDTRHVISVCGDGGFMMNSQEIDTAVRLGLHITVLILRDNAYGMIKSKQSGMGLAEYGLDYGNPDFVRYAEAYGARGHRVEAVGDLARLINDARHAGGVHLIEVPVDYEASDRAINSDIRAASSAFDLNA